MGTPNVTISKATFSSPQAPPSSVGVLAIIAAAATGTLNQPGGFARSDLALSAYGLSPLAEYAANVIGTSNSPVILERGNATYPGTIGTLISNPGTGTSTATFAATGTQGALDHWKITVTVDTGGTVGVAGILVHSTADGQTQSPSVALPATTPAVYAIPNTNITVSFAAGTLVAGATYGVFTERPLLGDADIPAAMAPLGLTAMPFEGVLIDSSASVSTVGLVDAILAAWEGKGRFKFALLNSRFKIEPAATGETEAAYALSIGPTFAQQTSIRVGVGADGARVPSPFTGLNLKRSAALLTGARAMAIQIGEDPAFVGRGPLPGAAIADAAGNPADHDEDAYPGLDALRLIPLRSFASGGPQGVYVNNANTMQPNGGNFPYLQHIRIANRACSIAWAILVTQLSRGVRKNLKPDPVTGAITIYEPDAALIDGLVADGLAGPLTGQVSGFNFALSRSDDLSQNPPIVTATLAISALIYIKGFAVTQQFVRTLSATIGA